MRITHLLARANRVLCLLPQCRRAMSLLRRLPRAVQQRRTRHDGWALLVLVTASALAQPKGATSDASPTEGFSLGVQATSVIQQHSRFRALYSGQNSLSPIGRTEETTDVTLFLGRRLGERTELWINPEIDQGFGFNNTLGVAGFPSGEAYKVGQNRPYLRLHRAFIRHTISLGGDDSQVDAATNQLPLRTTSDNLVLTIGKFSAVDLFDTNRYAHDPRADFLNWSIIDAGAFDYGADSWGYTFGAAAEWNRGSWTLRSGLFQLPAVPNGKVAGFHPQRHMIALEAERQNTFSELPGKIKLLAFVNRAPMGNYDDAVALAVKNAAVPDTGLVRRFQSRAGLAFNLEQKLASSVGMFARASLNDGSKEAYAFTEINRSIAAGVSVQGSSWQRKDDTIGVAGVVNGLSGSARRYFAGGGLGILIGDGQLSYAPERIFEAYYSARLLPTVTATADFQNIAHPGYNSDRGPVKVFSVRLHVEF